MTTSILVLVLHLISPDREPSLGGGPAVICCHFEGANNVCAMPGSGGCEAGDKAVLCRYGAWSDPESGAAECLPGS
jgi:hypothetical protein